MRLTARRLSSGRMARIFKLTPPLMPESAKRKQRRAKNAAGGAGGAEFEFTSSSFDYKPPDLAPCICRLPGFTGPVPPPLLIRLFSCASMIIYQIPPLSRGQSAKFVRIAGSAAKKLRRRSPAEFLCVYAAREAWAAQVRALPLSASKTCMTPPPKLKWTSSP